MGPRQLIRVCVISISLVLPLAAQEPDWAAMSYTPHSVYQAVDGNGAGTFSTNQPVKMRGVLINWPRTMLHTQAAYEPFLGGQWQVYVQATDTEDFGGTALWMGQYYGHLPFIGDPENVYTDEQWRAELDRLSYDAATGRLLRPGDLVEIRARAPGMFFNGKTNINEQHTVVPEADFDLVLLQAGDEPPEPQTITLAEVKNDVNQFIFDATRATGAEHYQGALVRIQNVQFTGGTWGPGEGMTIADATGRTFPVLLGLGSGFTLYGPPDEPFDIMGVFDQEDTEGSDGYRSGYRLWVMDYDGDEFVLYRYVRPDFDRDGDVDLDDLDHSHGCALGPAIPQPDPFCSDTDLNADESVDQLDFAILQRCFSGAERLADPTCDQ